MFRNLLTPGVFLALTAIATAEPPSDARVMASANVPPLASDVCVVKNRAMNGMLLPVPGFGFLPVPVGVWECTAFHSPPNAPAGARQLQNTVRLLTLAE